MPIDLKLKLNLDLTITHEPLEVYGAQRRVFLRKKRGESIQHVAMKLVSCVLFYHEELLIEESIGQHYKPDLVRLNEYEEPVQWVDCGQTSLQKLDKITRQNRQTYIEIVKPFIGQLAAYKEQADKRLELPERVRYWTFRGGFIDELSALLRTRHTLHATVAAEYEQLYLLVDERTSLRTPITYLGEADKPGAFTYGYDYEDETP